MKFFREYGNLVSRENTDKIVTALVEVLSPNVKALKCEDDSINHIVIMKTMDQIALIKRCALVSPKFAERLANSISVLINLIGLIISLFIYFNPNLNFFFCNLNLKSMEIVDSFIYIVIVRIVCLLSLYRLLQLLNSNSWE